MSISLHHIRKNATKLSCNGGLQSHFRVEADIALWLTWGCDNKCASFYTNKIILVLPWNKYLHYSIPHQLQPGAASKDQHGGVMMDGWLAVEQFLQAGAELC